MTAPMYIQVQTKTREFGWYANGSVPAVGHVINYRSEYGCIWDGPFVVTAVEWNIDGTHSSVTVLAESAARLAHYDDATAVEGGEG